MDWVPFQLVLEMPLFQIGTLVRISIYYINAPSIIKERICNNMEEGQHN